MPIEGAPFSNSHKGPNRLPAALEVILISSQHSLGHELLPSKPGLEGSLRWTGLSTHKVLLLSSPQNGCTCPHLGYFWVKAFPPKPHRLPYYGLSPLTDSQPQTWSHRGLTSESTLSSVTVNGHSSLLSDGQCMPTEDL